MATRCGDNKWRQEMGIEFATMNDHKIDENK